MKCNYNLILILFLVFFIFNVLFLYNRNLLVPFNADKVRRTYLLTGDEPAYLLTAYSIAFDFDTNIRNNILEKSWKSFQNRPVCGLYHGTYDYFCKISPPMRKISKVKWKNKQVMVYRPGISFLVFPAAYTKNFRWWSYFIVTNFSLFLLCVCVYILYSLGFDLWKTLFLVISFLLTPPSLFYMNQVFPEMPMAVLLFTGVVLSLKGDIFSVWSAFFLSLTPWFSDRALPASIFLLVPSFYYARKKQYRLLVVLIIFAVYGLLINYYYNRFGVPYPVHHNTRVHPSVFFVPKGLILLLFERSRGILWLSPILILSFSAFYTWMKTGYKKVLLVFNFIAFVLSILMVASFTDWKGGVCPAGRYGVIILFLSLPAFIVWFNKWKKNFNLACLLLMAGVVEGVILAQHPNWWYKKYHPIATISVIGKVYLKFLPNLVDWNLKELSKVCFWGTVFMLLNVFSVFSVSEIKLKLYRFLSGKFKRSKNV